MAIPWQLHEGNRSEYLAMYFLSKVGLVVPVPRQADLFNVDFIVHLIRTEEKNFVPTGKSFAMQVKSNTDPIPYKGDQLASLWELGLPYFVGMVSRDGMEFSIYSTLPRLNFMWMIGRDHDFRLCPGGKVEDLHAQEWENKLVRTGPEVIKLKAEDLDSDSKEQETRQLFFEIMSVWTEFEEVSLSWRKQNIPLVEMPQSYSSTVPPALSQRRLCVFANPITLHRICDAVQGPMFSLGYYLHDFKRRNESGELTASSDLMCKVERLAQAIETVKQECTTISKVFRQVQSQKPQGADKEG